MLESFEKALHSPQPLDALRALANHLYAQGQDQPTVLATFEKVRQELRQAEREKDEDVVLDVMDFLTGWCSPHTHLTPDQPTD